MSTLQGEPPDEVRGGMLRAFSEQHPLKAHPPKVGRRKAGGSRVTKIDPSRFKAPQCLIVAWGAKPRRVGATPDNPGTGCDVQEQHRSRVVGRSRRRARVCKRNGAFSGVSAQRPTGAKAVLAAFSKLNTAATVVKQLH